MFDLHQEMTPYIVPDDVMLDDPKQRLYLMARRILADLEPSRADPWVEDPDYPSEDWRDAVLSNETRQGYQAWVGHQKALEAEEPSSDNREFAVTIVERSQSRTEMCFAVSSLDPKKAFREAVNQFYSEENEGRRRRAEEITGNSYEVEVEDDDGNTYLFEDSDENDLPFVPENHLQE